MKSLVSCVEGRQPGSGGEWTGEREISKPQPRDGRRRSALGCVCVGGGGFGIVVCGPKTGLAAPPWGTCPTRRDGPHVGTEGPAAVPRRARGPSRQGGGERAKGRGWRCRPSTPTPPRGSAKSPAPTLGAFPPQPPAPRSRLRPRQLVSPLPCGRAPTQNLPLFKKKNKKPSHGSADHSSTHVGDPPCRGQLLSPRCFAPSLANQRCWRPNPSGPGGAARPPLAPGRIWKP